MTMPRCVLPDTTYLLTRRCMDRRFYLQAGPKMCEIFLYALAAAQLEFGVAVHALSCMSNHIHVVLTDTQGNLPDFTEKFHRELALAAKRLHGIRESVWNLSKSSAVALSREKNAAGKFVIDEKILYTLLNPVTAGLVAHAREWPGVISLPGQTEYRVRRPAYWFSKRRPEELTLVITPPPHIHDADAWHASLAEQVQNAETAVAEKRRQEGKGRVLGVKRVLAQRPTDRPRNADVVRPTRTPTLATGDRVQMMIEVQRLREWRRAYREARERWLTDKSTVFPPGTWWVVQRAGAAVA